MRRKEYLLCLMVLPIYEKWIRVKSCRGDGDNTIKIEVRIRETYAYDLLAHESCFYRFRDKHLEQQLY